MADARRQGAAALGALGALALCLAVAGCGYRRDVGLAQRCGDFMQQADPSASLDITKSDSAADGLDSMVATIAAKRTDLPPDSKLPHELTATCRFNSGVLTEFHRTAGPAG